MITTINRLRNNNPEAQFNLGLIERYGLGRPIEYGEVHFNWFEKSSRQQVLKDSYQCNELREGLIEAQYNLAQMYHYGLGVQ